MTTAEKLIARPGVLIIAHRGNSSVAPENTLPAFRSAVEVGSDLVELDYYHSADGRPVVFHDKTLDRTTNAVARWNQRGVTIDSVPWKKLAELDAGSWFDQKFAGTRVPDLAESLDLIQSGSVTLIERKAGDAETVVKLLREKELVGEVVVQSFDWKYVAACRRGEPKLVLAALGGGPITAQRLDDLEETGADIVAWHHALMTPTAIKAIHDRGLKAWVYTVDDPDRGRALIQQGIDGIITNKPATMLRLVPSGDDE